MALPELLANTTPGAAIATLTEALSPTGTTLKATAPAPEALRGAGQFHIAVDSEIMLVTAGASGTEWTVVRNVEVLTGGSGAVEHTVGASVFCELTVGALTSKFPARNAAGLIENGKAVKLGEVSGTVKLSWTEGNYFTATFVGETKFEVVNLPEGSVPTLIQLRVKQDATGGRAWSIPGVIWLNSEPSFETTAGREYVVTLVCVEGKVFGETGMPGTEGKAGRTIYSGEAAPESGVGNVGDLYFKAKAPLGFYVKTGGGWGALLEVTGEKGAPGTTASSVESMLGICPSVLNGALIKVNTASESFATAKRARFEMRVVPKEGHITKIWVRNGATAKGNTRVGIYDTGQKAVGEYSLIVQSAEVAQTGTNVWQLVEVPEHLYTAGQVIMIGTMNSTTEGTYGLENGAASNEACELPEGSLSGVAVAVPKLVAARTFTAFEFVAVTVANMTATASGPVAIIARVE
jgi:hypothetical protein